jgi:hypothetical protein
VQTKSCSKHATNSAVHVHVHAFADIIGVGILGSVGTG